MLRIKGNRSAFTLIELLVVVIIVAVLAAVGVPLLSANVTRAKGSEAEAGLGAIRTSLRSLKAESGVYPTLTAADPSSAAVAQQLGLAIDDLNGRWFTNGSYRITSDDTGYCISADGNLAFGPGADAGSKTVKRAMNCDGTVYKDTTTCTASVCS